MSTRSIYFLGFAIVCLLLGTSIYMQLFQGLIPCPLCTLQRLAFALLGIWFLVGSVFVAKRGMRLSINFLCLITSLLGLLLAGRQVWLQHFPGAEGGECGVSLQYMMQVLPWNEVMQKVLAGSVECSQRGADFLFLSMPEWALLCFGGFLVVAVVLIVREIRK